MFGRCLDLVKLRIQVRVVEREAQLLDRLPQRLEFDTRDRGLAGVGRNQHREVGRVGVEEQLHVLVLAVEHGEVQAQLAIEQVRLEADLVQRHVLGVERVAELADVDRLGRAARLVTRRDAQVRADVVRPLVVRRERRVELARLDAVARDLVRVAARLLAGDAGRQFESRSREVAERGRRTSGVPGLQPEAVLQCAARVARVLRVTTADRELELVVEDRRRPRELREDCLGLGLGVYVAVLVEQERRGRRRPGRP